MDTFRDSSHRSFFGRMGNSFGGIIVGLVLVVAAPCLLFWNEGRAVHEAKRIAEGQAACVSVDAANLDPANEGKLIHIAGQAVTPETLSDKIFGISAPAVRLKRTVEMYQWSEKKSTETHKTLGGGEDRVTTYNYTQSWSDKLIDSSDFTHRDGHDNPRGKPIEDFAVSASVVNVGAYKLSGDLIGMMQNFQPLQVSADSITLLNTPQGQAKFTGDQVYIGADAANPKVGDSRVHFQTVPPGPVSVIAQQINGSFTSFHSPHGETLMLSDGLLTADQMFTAAKERNAMITWGVRVGGFIGMWIGLMMIVGPLRVLADVLPWIGNLVGALTGFIAFLISAACSSLVIAIAWLVYRPIIGVLFFVAAAGLIVLIRRTHQKNRIVSSVPPIPPPIPS